MSRRSGVTVLPVLQQENGPAYLAPEVITTTKGQTYDDKVCRRGWAACSGTEVATCQACKLMPATLKARRKPA